MKSQVQSTLYDIARNDPKSLVCAAAIGKLDEYENPEYLSFFKKAVNDSSYSVAGNALNALGNLDSAAAFSEAKKLMNTTTKGNLQSAINTTLIRFGDESSAGFIIGNFEKMPVTQAKLDAMQSLIEFLPKVTDATMFKRGIDAIITFREAIPESVRSQVANYINNILLTPLANKLSDNKEFSDYIKTKISGEEKKGF